MTQDADTERRWRQAAAINGLRRLIDAMEADLRGDLPMERWQRDLAYELDAWWAAHIDNPVCPRLGDQCCAEHAKEWDQAGVRIDGEA
jgi:hypothetical protein